MPITVRWDNEAKTVIRYDFEGYWDWDEFRTAANEAFAFTRSVQHRVDSISYFRAGSDLPSDALFQFNRIMKTAPENRGTTVIVGGSMFINNLVSIFSKIYKPLGQKLRLATTLNEARDLLSAGEYKASKIEQ
jgi:hypothetical protein